MTRKLVPTAVAAVALDITPAGVRLLIHRGILTRYGTLKRALVDLAECERRKHGEAA
jgi:hypothetical protein